MNIVTYYFIFVYIFLQKNTILKKYIEIQLLSWYNDFVDDEFFKIPSMNLMQGRKMEMKMLFHEQQIDGVVNKICLSEPEIYVDNEKRGRSGHMGHALVEFAPGKIMAFNANTSAKRL